MLALAGTQTNGCRVEKEEDIGPELMLEDFALTQKQRHTPGRPERQITMTIFCVCFLPALSLTGHYCQLLDTIAQLTMFPVRMSQAEKRKRKHARNSVASYSLYLWLWCVWPASTDLFRFSLFKIGLDSVGGQICKILSCSSLRTVARPLRTIAFSSFHARVPP